MKEEGKFDKDRKRFFNEAKVCIDLTGKWIVSILKTVFFGFACLGDLLLIWGEKQKKNWDSGKNTNKIKI